MTTHSRLPGDRAVREFHISRAVREAYGLSDALFSVTGNVVFADFRAARELAHSMNSKRDTHRHPETAVQASRLYALGLIDEVLHLVIANHRRERAPQMWAEALEQLEGDLGRGRVDGLLRKFIDEFPPVSVFRGAIESDTYLRGSTDGLSNRELVIEELVLLWLANRNPAFAEFRELFDDSVLRQEADYGAVMERVEAFLGHSVTGGLRGETLLDRLCAPMRAAPMSLEGQLAYLRTTWVEILGPDLHRVLGGLDFIAEEERAYFPAAGDSGGDPGPGPVEPPDFTSLYEEVENYSVDLDWMPRLVLVAKNARVWLAQLSRKFEREIVTLAQVPDEELEEIGRAGFTGLWLIGVWARSRASERIKRKMGDHDAVASAYSLEDYVIAGDLGGEEAYEDLRARAWRYGIRLSTDMVPNHMGIDSRWVIEHPEWFLTVDRPPYPSYSFDGPDLSDDPRVGIFIEDGYWSKSDAAVVFRRLDRATGSERFIYHGNDGTSMPWNDTAQLDYTNPDVREAVIQTILAVARRSPVIRFDAAMTLTRMHYHRLWFPEPGAAGAVPSRVEFGMSKSEFDARMPQEFWREVVDRVAVEAPDTLLLAEAFWLLEGYFVRTLGMHRVYNSAFMNMLRDERNQEYRQLIRSTLEFDPQILKRYVNFMSNPDERTAVDQFGTGDKYFGVVTMMATLPGLPMFGHGQVEGLAEKYGMEFQRPRWAESADEGLVERHRRQLFPLLRRRHLFAEVDRFKLFDFESDAGSIDENVFAYSNDVAGQRSLVIFHNSHGNARGTLRLSTGVVNDPGNPESGHARTTLGDALRIPDHAESVVIMRDATTGLEHLWSCRHLRRDGMKLELGPYRLHVFADIREAMSDPENPWAELAAELGGAGVRSVDEALGLRVMAPVLDPIRRMLDISVLEGLTGADTIDEAIVEVQGRAAEEVERIVAAAAHRLGYDGPHPKTVIAMLNDLEAVLALQYLVRGSSPGVSCGNFSSTQILSDALARPERVAAAMMWVVARHLGRLGVARHGATKARDRFVRLHLGALTVEVGRRLGLTEEEARGIAAGIELMILADGMEPGGPEILRHISADQVGARLLGINIHRGVSWFNRELFLELVGELSVASCVRVLIRDPADAIDGVVRVCDAALHSTVAADASGYRTDDFLAGLDAEAGREDAED